VQELTISTNLQSKLGGGLTSDKSDESETIMNAFVMGKTSLITVP
jgi:hypothetical protein